MRFCAWRPSGVLVAVAMLGVLVAPASARPGGAKKVWVDLGQGQALGINDQGVVVGSVGGFGVFRAVMWKNGVQINLGTLSRGLVECGASAINKSGHVVGNCSNRSGSTTHAFVWFRGKMRDLGTLRGSSSSDATAISNNGIIGGLSTPNGAGNPHAVMWRNGVIRDLGVLGSGYVQSIGRGVNNGGQVVGWSTQSSSFEQAFRWTNGRMTALRAPSGAQSEATAINNRGQVAGGLLGSGGLKPALWAGGPAIVLRTLGGDGAALAINQLGQVAGWVATSNNGSHAAMWSNRRLIDLGSVRRAPTIAAAINNLGEVAGRADLSRGMEAVALLTARRLGSGHFKSLGNGRVDSPPGLP